MIFISTNLIWRRPRGSGSITDHPRQIDWRWWRPCCWAAAPAARSRPRPRYNFVTHTRQRTFKKVTPKPIVLVDGLWLLRRPGLRHLFGLRVFIHCPTRLRLERRLQRDLATRGRDGRSVRRQFNKTVAPMHKRFVAPQARWADVVLHQPVGQGEVDYLAALIEDGAEGEVKNLWSATRFHCAQGSHDGAPGPEAACCLRQSPIIAPARAGMELSGS